MDSGDTGNGSQLRRRRSFNPWKRPQSNRMRLPPCSSRYFEPVTVRAAPRKVSVATLARYQSFDPLARAPSVRGLIFFPYAPNASTGGMFVHRIVRAGGDGLGPGARANAHDRRDL